MKKIVRLTENDITRIVKRIIKENEDMGNPIKCAQKYVYFAFLTGKKGGDLPYWNDDVIPGKNDTEAYKRFIKYLKDVMDTSLYDDKECEGVTFDDVAPFIRELYLKQIDNHYLGEAKRPSNVDRTNLPGGIKKRVIDSLESAAYYTKGTKHNIDSIKYYLDKGHDVVMYSKGNDRIFVDSMSKNAYDEQDYMVGKVTGNMDDWAMDYFENSMNEAKGNRMNEALGLLDRKKYSDLPGGIVKRKITDYASAKRYTMGTKVSADLIMRLIERGGNVFMYTDRSSDKIFIDTLSKGVYDQLDRRIGEVTGNMDDWAMDYFDN